MAEYNRSFDGMNVYILDLDDGFCEKLEKEIKRYYGTSLSFSHGRHLWSALQYAGKSQRLQRPDCIVTATNTPEPTGLQLLWILKDSQEFKAIPVIFITDYDSGWLFHYDQFKCSVIEDGASDCLCRPCEVREVISAIANAVLVSR